MADSDLPIGFTMSLAQHMDALQYFGELDYDTQHKIVDFIQASQTGDDARSRIHASVDGLCNQDLKFLK